jgi:hypothetical protein
MEEQRTLKYAAFRAEGALSAFFAGRKTPQNYTDIKMTSCLHKICVNNCYVFLQEVVAYYVGTSKNCKGL